MEDIRDIIFKNIINTTFEAELISERDGILAGVEEAGKQAAEIGIDLELCFKDGDRIQAGDILGKIVTVPKKIALAEEKIIGSLAKYSGIATAAKRAVEIADGRVKIVTGSWKKMPPQIKNEIRKAVDCGGASFRISDKPMIYLDKNYIKMFGSIPEALCAVKDYKDYVKVVQLKGREYSIENETLQAIENGAHFLMVDTGDVEDLNKCLATVRRSGVRDQVKIAFAGNVNINQIKDLIGLDLDILCIGKDILDAPLLDIRIDVMKRG